MNRRELEHLWQSTLRAARPSREQFERLADAVVASYGRGDPGLDQHLKNRLKQIGERTGVVYDADRLDLAAARDLVADESGFADWGALLGAVDDATGDGRPLLFLYAVAAMERGDFSALEGMVGGAGCFDDQIIDWYDKGYFETEPGTLAEILSAACMLGHARAAGYLLDKGVDSLAGIKTGLNGFHWAASSGRLDLIRLFIEKKVPIQVRNMYGGTVLDQALWSAINEYSPDHADIIEALIDAGAVIEPGTLEWWRSEDVPSDETRARVIAALERAGTS